MSIIGVELRSVNTQLNVNPHLSTLIAATQNFAERSYLGGNVLIYNQGSFKLQQSTTSITFFLFHSRTLSVKYYFISISSLFKTII